jgi:hypothetical protein
VRIASGKFDPGTESARDGPINADDIKNKKVKKLQIRFIINPYWSLEAFTL